MLSDEVLEKVVDRITKKIAKGNMEVLIRIGRRIREIRSLSPTEAKEIITMLRFGGDYDKIVNYLSKISRMNVKEIEKIFDNLAEKEYNSYKKLYEYRNIKFEPYESSYLKTQVKALSQMAGRDYVNLTKTSNIGFGIEDSNGEIVYKGFKEAYYEILDKAVINVAQGKRTFDDVMYKSIKAIGNGGLRVIFPTTYVNKDGVITNNTMRVDSAVRMNLRSSIRNLHNETQKIIAKEIDADGVEILPHENPAPDHAQAQGHQFSMVPEHKHGMSEWSKLQRYGRAKDYEGNEIDLHLNLKKGGRSASFRPISADNCYHEIKCVVLGVNKPTHTKKELEEILQRNNEGFDFEGKHYTMYEGEQLQRRIELEVRKMKELHVFGQKTKQQDIMLQAKKRINVLMDKYSRLSKASNLPYEYERTKVMGYNPRLKLS